jgi:hypothetical protein
MNVSTIGCSKMKVKFGQEVVPNVIVSNIIMIITENGNQDGK